MRNSTATLGRRASQTTAESASVLRQLLLCSVKSVGTEKRARQKAGKAARRQERKVAEARSKRTRTFIRIAVIAGIAVGLFFLISYCSRDRDSEEVTSSEPPALAPTTTAPPAPGEEERMLEEDEMKRSNNEIVYTPYRPEDYGSGPCAPPERSGEPRLRFENPPALCINPEKSYAAVFNTTRGTVKIALDAVNTPGTVNSFVNLARFGYYDDTLIHRSDPSIGILQGGSPTTNSASDPGPGYQLWDEGTGFKYRPGQLVMARTRQPNSAGAQYFFTVTEDASLLDGDGTYVVFGEVIEGLDVLSEILDSHVAIPGSGLGGAPDPEVRIRVSIEESDR